MEQLGGDVGIHFQVLRIDFPGNLPDLCFSGRIFFRDLIFKNQPRAGKGLCPAPFI